MQDDEVNAGQPGTSRGDDVDATGAVMHLLAEHVPLTLLADLAAVEPRSDAILRAEGLPDEAWWEGDGPPGHRAPEDAGPPRVTLPTQSAGPEDAVPVDPDAAVPPSPA